MKFEDIFCDEKITDTICHTLATAILSVYFCWYNFCYEMIKENFSMKPSLDFRIDKKTVTEGDIVFIQWSCPEAEQIQLIINNGFKANVLDVESTGNKKFRLNRSKGRTKLSLSVSLNGKIYTKTIAVRVKKQKTINPEYVDGNNRNKTLEGIKGKWQNLKTKIKYSWQYLPERKRLAYIVLSLLSILMLLSSFFPQIIGIGVCVVAVYLLIVILKK